MDDGLYLIYINNLGVDYLDSNVMEFIFSDTTKNIDGEDWDAIPACGRPQPPYKKFIKKIGQLNTTIDFEYVQDTTCFAVYDSMDGVIALAWEDLSEYETYPDSRLVFHFGESQEKVEAKLYERDLTLKYKNNTND